MCEQTNFMTVNLMILLVHGQGLSRHLLAVNPFHCVRVDQTGFRNCVEPREAVCFHFLYP